MNRTDYTLERELAPGVDPRWSEDFILEARLRDVPGTVIGDALGEVNDHCVSSGLSAAEAFGPAREYAASVAENTRTDSTATASPRMTTILAPTFLQIAGVVTALSGVGGLAAGTEHPLGWTTLAIIALFAILLPFAGRFLVWGLRLAVETRALGVVLFSLASAALFAAPFAVMVVVGPLDGGAVPLPAWVVLAAGLALLVAGTAAELRVRRTPVMHDPLVPAGAPAPRARTIPISSLTAWLWLAVGAAAVWVLT